ncbi:sigma-70 family RNA polymerase sigma factor [Nostoc sp. KVJ3]|uniref:sigma-70 family RNA polymerase sigma factor n=1 Tax=Nostoc sp. KVJ3 TaxID=457945 RepID=UPI002237D5EF|nr:sigma-70 family RNA polymerase sigma factor [Nostoc sp. KVJ3]MCW5312982.1 sigma-70 family RNA polymerase sigma factor [Nostoc sp. KVJ3]
MLNQLPILSSLQHLVHRFYMYMTVDNSIGRRAIQWKSEPHLQRNIDLYKTQHDQFAGLLHQKNEQGLVQFWLDMALNNLPSKYNWEPENRIEKAWEHLSLYCEESCYRAASQVWKENQYKCWEEYIFFARCLVYDPVKFRKILAKYDPSISPLYAYIIEVLRKTIKDDGSVAKFSKWRLLCKKSNKELKEALIRYGICEPEVSRFLFACKYFKQVYQFNKIQNPATRSGQRWVEPDSNDFQEAAQYYNAEKVLAIAPHQVAVGKNVTGEQLQWWMETCITALRNYPQLIAPSISLEVIGAVNYKIESHGGFNLEIEDSIPEQESLCQRTETVLQHELLALNEDQKEILYLYYELGWNQKQIAAKFAVTQGAITRRLQTIERRLINAVYSLKQPPQWVTGYVKTWLNYNYETPDYSDLIHTALVTSVKQLNTQSQDLLRLYYGQKLDPNAISNQLDLPPDRVNELLSQTNSELEIALLKELDRMIRKFLNIWLTKQYKNINSYNSNLQLKHLILT